MEVRHGNAVWLDCVCPRRAGSHRKRGVIGRWKTMAPLAGRVSLRGLGDVWLRRRYSSSGGMAIPDLMACFHPVCPVVLVELDVLLVAARKHPATFMVCLRSAVRD